MCLVKRVYYYAYECNRFTRRFESCSLKEALAFEGFYLYKITGVMARMSPVYGTIWVLDLRESQLER